MNLNFQQLILKETPHWIAINKPSGMLVEENPFEAGAVEELLKEYLSQKVRNPYVGIVHRLDRVTSGVLLLAKRRSTLKKFNAFFSEGQIQKTYRAVVDNPPPEKEGVLVHWLKKDPEQKKAIVFPQKRRDAVRCELSYQILEEHKGKCVLAIHPKTGKYHQIRAQLAAINCPILGDTKYNGANRYTKSIALHAQQLKFPNPQQSEDWEIVEAPVPKGKWSR